MSYNHQYYQKDELSIGTNRTTSIEVVNKMHKNFHLSRKLENILYNNFYDNYSTDDNIRFIVLQSFHGKTIMEPGWYDCHSFMIIAPPCL